jgi:hypothetical protein
MISDNLFHSMRRCNGLIFCIERNRQMLLSVLPSAVSDISNEIKWQLSVCMIIVKEEMW